MPIDIRKLSRTRKYKITTKDGGKSSLIDPFHLYDDGYHVWFLDKVWDRLWPERISFEELESKYELEVLPLKKPKQKYVQI